MRRTVAVIAVVLAACASTPYWRHAPSAEVGEELHDGSEVLLITDDRAIHLADTKIQNGFVSGRAEHVWKIPAGIKISTTDYDSKPVDLALRNQWTELADAPGPVTLSTIRFARILNVGGGGRVGLNFLIVIVGVVALIAIGAALCDGSDDANPYSC